MIQTLRRYGLGLSLSFLSAANASATEVSMNEFISDFEKRSIQYFIDNTDAKTGLVKDRARNFDATPRDAHYNMASLAATGFGFTVLASAAERGIELRNREILTREKAYEIIFRGLTTAKNDLFQFHGWFYHFVDATTGVRSGNCEVSTIDTALFIAGALTAAQIFPNTPLANLARELYYRLDFKVMMTDGGADPDRRKLTMGWLPENGGKFLTAQWWHYSEVLILSLLSLGHPTAPLPPDAWDAWKRETPYALPSKDYIGSDLPLFEHQYSQLYVDFRHIKDNYRNYFLNSQLATRDSRETTLAKKNYVTYKIGMWGISASGSPDGYRPFAMTEHDQNGTVCPGCVVGSAPFDTENVLSDMRKWAAPNFLREAAEKFELRTPANPNFYNQSLIGNYGFTDSVNIDREWVDPDILGITAGPAYMALTNLNEETSIWRLFSKIPEIEAAIKIAAFKPEDGVADGGRTRE